MGLFWDWIQQSQISNQSSQTDSLERRVAELERQMDAMSLGEDINRDGRIG